MGVRICRIVCAGARADLAPDPRGHTESAWHRPVARLAVPASRAGVPFGAGTGPTAMRGSDRHRDVMSGVRTNLRESRQARWLVAALTCAAIALAGCGAGDSNDDGDAAVTTTSPSKTATGGEAEPILIKTRTNIPAGKILDGSAIGDSPFCPGGTLIDQHGTPEIGLVDRTITCLDGTLRMGFDPQVPVGDTQSGPWRIISGTGAYQGWEGKGEMRMRYDPSDNREHPTRGRERYTGTVTH